MFRVDDILEGQKGDQGGGPKLAKIQCGVKPNIIKRATQMAKFLGGLKFQLFGPPLRPLSQLLHESRLSATFSGCSLGGGDLV